MKTSSRLLLLVGLLISSVHVFGQQIEVTKFEDDCKNESFSDDPTYYNQQVYNSETKTFSYCLNGITKTNKVQIPEGEGWFTRSFGNELYFKRTYYKKNTYTYEYAHYDYKNNIVDKPIKLLSATSSSDPSWYSEREFTSPNKQYRALRINPGKATSSTFTSTSTVISVFNQALEILYTKELTFEFTNKEFNYDLSNFLGNDGSWYWFGIKYSGKGDTKTGQYGCYITNPEGNTSAFMPIDFNEGYIQDVNNFISGDKLIQFGTWSNDEMSGTLSGSFYMELDLTTMEVITKQTTTLSGEELGKFVFTSGLQSKVAKEMHISGIEILNLKGNQSQFENGRYVAAYRRNVTFEIGSTIIMTFGPKAEDMTHTFLLVNQRSPGRDIPFSAGGVFINNTVVLFFNDHEANAGITQNGDPRLFEPFSAQQKATTTYAVMYSEDGNLKREQIASYKADDRVYWLSGQNLSNDSFIIYMREDPPMNLGDDAFSFELGTPYQVTIK